MDLFDLILKIIPYASIASALLGLIVYIWNKQDKKIDKMEIRIKKNEDDIIDFRLNYKDQFKRSDQMNALQHEEIKEKNATAHAEIKEKNAEEHTEIKIMIAKIFTKLGIE